MKHASKRMLLDTLGKFGRCDVTVYGESMKPFIRRGDVATIVASNSPPLRGEVVAFFNGNQLIVHRVLRRKKNGDRTWSLAVYGDSSPCSGGTVLSSRVIGIVRHIKRDGRKHSLWLSSPLRILALPAGFLFRCRVSIGRRLFKP
jgi:hypothetical protein